MVLSSVSAALSRASSNAMVASCEGPASLTGDVSGLIANLCLFGGGFFFPLACVVLLLPALLATVLDEDASIVDVEARFRGERRGDGAE